MAVARAVAPGWASRQKIVVTRESVNSLCIAQSFDGSRARNLLGYKPVYTFEDAMSISGEYLTLDPEGIKRHPQGPYKYEDNDEGQYQ